MTPSDIDLSTSCKLEERPSPLPLERATTMTDLFDTSNLAPSPEHPEFLNETKRDTLSNLDGFILDSQVHQHDSGTSLPSSQSLPFHALSHASSISSLNSISSMAHSSSGLGVGIAIDPLDSMTRSRESSFSLNAKVEDGDFNMWTMPTYSVAEPNMQAHRLIDPALRLQTHGINRAVETRSRSKSRVQPYHRERSTSISMCSEEGEDPVALLSATSTRSTCSTSWSNPLVTPLNRMSLHHRRTSSNASAFSQKASPVSLSRAHRSASVTSRYSLDPFETNSAAVLEEREATVQHKLKQKADEVRAAPPGSQQDKLRTLWVKHWLQLSYCNAVGSTVPRQGLYHSYTKSCLDHGVPPINSASFGKAVRGAYPGIKTRRLGNRGNSKYHYVSLRPAVRIEADRLNEYLDLNGKPPAPLEGAATDFALTDSVEMDEDDVEAGDTEEEDFTSIKKATSTVDMRRSRPANFGRRHTTTSVPTMPFAFTPVDNFLGFPTLNDIQLGHLTGPGAMFWNALCRHLESLTQCVRHLRFDQFEIHCRSFWAQRSPLDMEIAQQPEMSLHVDHALSKAYNHFLSILFEKLISPVSEATLPSLHQLADELQTIMEQSMQNFSPQFCEPKIELSVRLGHLFHRYIALHQLTASLEPILSDPEQVRHLLRAWEELDERLILDQCALSTECRPDLLSNIMVDFFTWLSETEARPSRGFQSMEKLGSWIQGLLDGMRGPNPTNRSIVVRVGFLTSQILRDFTLRSDRAFGAFQLVKTWIDDWIILYVLRQHALSRASIDVPTGIPKMSVIIPTQSHGPLTNDLSTAVPYNHGPNTALSITLGDNNVFTINPGFGLPTSRFLQPSNNPNPSMSNA